MLNRLAHWLFGKKKPIQNFSTTLTDATEGSPSRLSANPELAKQLNEGRKKNVTTSGTVKEASEYFLNVPGVDIQHPVILNPDISKMLMFTANHVHYVRDENDDVTDILIMFDEITLGGSLSIRVSVKDYHEIFQPSSIPDLFSKKGTVS